MRDLTTARKGDWGTVAGLVAQRLLNMNMEPHEDGLVEDGKFGEKTYRAAVRFQRRPGHKTPLAVDGVVGPKTFEALGLKTLKSHAVLLRPQRRAGSCWAAAASMLLGGREPAPGPAQTDRRGALVATDENVKTFGGGLGWDFLPARATDVQLLARLQRTPLWMAGESVNARSTADSIHAVVLAGMYGYEWAASPMLLLKVYDPWPIGSGRIYFMEFHRPRLPGGNTFSVRWFLAPTAWSR